MDVVPYEKQTIDNPNPIARFTHKAAFLGIPARRADDIKTSHRGFDWIKTSHRGFDWRVTQQTLLENFRCVNIEFSPLPFKSPYGQSQVLMLFQKSLTNRLMKLSRSA